MMYSPAISTTSMPPWGLVNVAASSARSPRHMSRPRNQIGHLQVVAYGGTFAGARLDAGTELLLSTRRRWPVGRAIDIGCGNGILSATLARLGCSVTATDTSAAAIRSTHATLAANHLDADVLWSDGLSALPDRSADLIVTNPPFHIGHAKDSTPTLAFLDDAARVLTEDGEIFVVYNAHLPYLQALGQAFGHADIIARDRDYLVARAVAHAL